MQTFLPYSSFSKSARVLDRQRLGKQRVEAMQILQCLLGIGSQRWRHHPAVKMWKGYEYQLCQYALAICTEWKSRGYRDTVTTTIKKLATVIDGSKALPPWIGDRKFHASHQSNLIRKDPAHYKKYFPKISGKRPYVWPIKRDNDTSTRPDPTTIRADSVVCLHRRMYGLLRASANDGSGSHPDRAETVYRASLPICNGAWV